MTDLNSRTVDAIIWVGVTVETVAAFYVIYRLFHWLRITL